MRPFILLAFPVRKDGLGRISGEILLKCEGYCEGVDEFIPGLLTSRLIIIIIIMG